MLIDNLKVAYLKSRKEKNEVARSVLSTLPGDVETKMKVSPKFGDSGAVALCKKMIEGNLSTIALKVPNSDILLQENSILAQFLPKQLSAVDLHYIIDANSLHKKKLPEIMKFFKENYAGQYDGKMLSDIVKGI